MSFQLKVIGGTGKDLGRVFDLPEQGSLLLGRGPESASRFNDLRVSGSHCRVYAERGRVTITDIGSTNGTFVNDKALIRDELRDLNPGDVIRLGENTRMEVTGADVAVMKTVAGDAGMLAREIAAAMRTPVPPVRPSVSHSPSPVAAPPVSRSSEGQPAEPTVELVCSCQQRLVAREKYAGTRIRCPNCRNVIQLPGRAALAQPVSEELFDVPLPPELAQRSRWRWLVTAAAGLLLVVAAAACLATFFNDKNRSTDGSRKGTVEHPRRIEAL